MGALKIRANSGSMGSQMRCTDMLQKVANESNKMARCVAADKALEEVEPVWGKWN
jgi:hypothetical protein